MSMSLMHSLLEFASAGICILIAVMAWRRYRKVPSGFNLLWAVAFGITGVEDVIHGGLALIDPSLVSFWVPWTWATARLTLAGMLFLAVIWSRWKIPTKTVIPVVTVAVVTSCLALAPVFGAEFGFVYQDGPIYRPLDFLVMVIWAGLWFALYRNPTAKIQAPTTFHLFMGLGVAVHATMAFGSAKSLDPAFMLAHILKVIEYLAWAAAILTDDIFNSLLDPDDKLALIRLRSQGSDTAALHSIEAIVEENSVMDPTVVSLTQRFEAVEARLQQKRDAHAEEITRTGGAVGKFVKKKATGRKTRRDLKAETDEEEPEQTSS